MADTDKKGKTSTAGGPMGGVPKVKWDDSGMTTSYANVCNVAGTREEVTLLFGTNQTGLSDQQVSVRLSDRIILSPYAAKRLASLLNNVVAQYEKRFGDLNIDAPTGDVQ